MPRSLVNTTASIRKIEDTAPKLPDIRNVGQVKAAIDSLEKLRLEFNAFLPEVAAEVSRMEQLRDLLFRNFANNNAAIRELIAERDRIRANRLYQSQKRRNEMVERKVGVGYRDTEVRSETKMGGVEARAERLFGVKVSADEFEILTIKNRPLTDAEIQLLARIASDTEGVQEALEGLDKKLTDILTREVSLRQQFEKWAGVNWDTYAKSGPIAALAQRIQGAVETFRTYDTQIKQAKARLDAGIATMKSIRNEVGNITDTTTFGDVSGTLNLLATLGVGGGLAALTLGVNPVAAGVIMTLGLLAKVGELVAGVWHSLTSRAAAEDE